MQACRKCFNIKDYADFNKCGNNISGYSYICHSCLHVRRKKADQQFAELRRERKREVLRRHRLTEKAKATRVRRHAEICKMPARPPTEPQRCTQCKVEKQYADFHLHAARLSGYCSICKICSNANHSKTSRLYCRNNKTARAASNRKWHQENKELIRAKKRAHRKTWSAERLKAANKKRNKNRMKRKYGEYHECLILIKELEEVVNG